MASDETAAARVGETEADGYRWRVGDVFTDGRYRWRVDSLHAGERAVLRSCASAWATTLPLTYGEWHEGHRWRLETDLLTRAQGGA